MGNFLFDLTGKTALVTGSSRGIGMTLARGLGNAGAKLVLNGTNDERLDEAVKELRSEGLLAYGSLFDVTDPSKVEEKIKEIHESIGHVDILVNNAGIQKRGPLETFELHDWQHIMDINLTGPLVVAQCVVKGMIQRKCGKIINICSLQSELARPTIAPYAASKGGVRMLTKAMAAEWAKYNIQVNGIGPGYFITEMTQPLAEDKEFDSWLKARTPAGRWGNTDELIGAAVFFASKASDFVNGQILYVDGGLSSAI